MIDSFVHQFGCEEYTQSFKFLDEILFGFNLAKNHSLYSLSQKENFSLELLIHSGVHQQIIDNIQFDLNAIFFSEGGDFASSFHPFGNIITKQSFSNFLGPYDIFLDGAFGILLKNKDNFPLAVLGFSINDNKIFVTQIQGVNSSKTQKIHRSINRVLWRELFFDFIVYCAKDLGKSEIVFQSAKNSYWDKINKTSRGIDIYDNYFIQKGLLQKVDGNFYLQV